MTTHRVGGRVDDVNAPNVGYPTLPIREGHSQETPGVTACRACGQSFTRIPGPGRPRLYCPSCVPSGPGYGRAWTRANPASVAASNAQRRGRHRATYQPTVYRRACAECGSAYETHQPRRRFCSVLCRQRHRANAWARVGGRIDDVNLSGTGYPTPPGDTPIARETNQEARQ